MLYAFMWEIKACVSTYRLDHIEKLEDIVSSHSEKSQNSDLFRTLCSDVHVTPKAGSSSSSFYCTLGKEIFHTFSNQHMVLISKSIKTLCTPYSEPYVLYVQQPNLFTVLQCFGFMSHFMPFPYILSLSLLTPMT